MDIWNTRGNADAWLALKEGISTFIKGYNIGSYLLGNASDGNWLYSFIFTMRWREKRIVALPSMNFLDLGWRSL